MNEQTYRLAARGYAENNLRQLAIDVLEWNKTAYLAPSSKIHELAALCKPFAGEGYEYLEAKTLTANAAIKQAADSESSSYQGQA